MQAKGYNLTCGEVIDNLLTLADAYEKASAGKAPSGFLFNPTDAAANMKAAVHFIGSFGQQIPQWIPVDERLPEISEDVLVCDDGVVWISSRAVWDDGKFWAAGLPIIKPTHWMPLPEPPEVK